MPVAVPITNTESNSTKIKLLDVEDVLSRLTLPEKVSLLSGKDNWHTRDIPKYGIPSLRLSDGPNGCRGTKFFEGVPAACFPCATGLASTWDVDLIQDVGVALGDECRAKGVHVLLAPTVNMLRTPLNGRGFESFSEDPLLSGYLAGGLIKGVQSTGVAATLKHLVCNDQETERVSQVDEKTLREIYLKPFEIAIRESNPWLVMTSYNRLNGKHTSETLELIDGLLRKEWGYEGLVVSDWHGTYSTDEAIKAGLDLEMPGPSIIRGPALLRMVTCGKVKEEDINDRVRNVLRLVNRLIPSGIPRDAEENQNPNPAVDVMRQSAADAIVLLKNEKSLLPISPNTKRIAVIGPNAAKTEIFGGGSAALRATYTVSPLEGIRSAAGPRSKVVYAKGCDAHKLTPLVGEELRNSQGQPGFDIRFYNDPPPSTSLRRSSADHREVVHELTTTNSNMFFNDNLPDTLNRACYATATAKFTPGRTGTYEFGVGALGVSDLYVDDVLLIDNSTSPIPGELFYGKGSREEIAEIHLEANVTYRVRVEYASPSASTSFVGPLALSSRGGLRFGGYLKLSPEEHIREAVELARSSDVVIIVAGLNAEFETEGFDRKDMKLPSATLKLINAVLEVRKDAVICLQSGTPVEIPFKDKCESLIHFFYNGNETGNGLADVLFGRTNPSGKLPFTIPEKLEDSLPHSKGDKDGSETFPGQDGKVCYEEGLLVGYRQYSTVGPTPAFAFGHGLSYTSFEYDAPQLSASVFDFGVSSTLEVTCAIRNTGTVAGREIIQCYISPPTSTSSDRPTIELKAFKKTAQLEPGQREIVKMTLDRESFAIWEEGWIVRKGIYEVLIASSSEDIRETAQISVIDDFRF
ncbi:uncharacterized protein I303_108675 [Kwoniella dejecticola CBS 10117]|uniref:beta-glucosidase n=1 Tax=Kwoniella dejecticola CBS 10117 TaxID=1296121 RepID=A0AAJ8MLU0_9TREE